MTMGTPFGTIGTAITAAGTLHGCDYVLAGNDQPPGLALRSRQRPYRYPEERPIVG